jgi:3-oxoadipate enol-lactonase
MTSCVEAQGHGAASDLNWIRMGQQGSATVVLLHSWGLDLTYWDRQIEALIPTYDVIALDFRGHGTSPKPPNGWGVAQAVEDVSSLVLELGQHPVHVVGVSFGGMVAQALALAHPNLVRSLTLISTASSFSERSSVALRANGEAVQKHGMEAALQLLKHWLSASRRLQRPDLVDRITKTLKSGDAAVFSAMWPKIAMFDITERLGEIKCPTMAIVCEEDANTPLQSSKTIVEHVGNASLFVLPGTAHLAHLEAPNEVNSHILKFLSHA